MTATTAVLDVQTDETGRSPEECISAAKSALVELQGYFSQHAHDARRAGNTSEATAAECMLRSLDSLVSDRGVLYMASLVVKKLKR